MDTFDLKWPKTQATFYTDGWRCRIVWRAQGGPGGSIDNNDLSKRRLADSLSGAPYLLPALRARGYGNLASEIESLVEQEAGPVESGDASSSARPGRPPVAAPRAEVRRTTQVDRIQSWLADLPGDATFAETGDRRARVWLEAGAFGAETLLLKSPAAKGKQEWVLKRTWPDGDAKQASRKPEYVAAPHLRGVLSYLAGRGADASVFESLLGACKLLDHPDPAQAAASWRNFSESTTH